MGGGQSLLFVAGRDGAWHNGWINPGLLTEEYYVTQRQVRGNAPQAFVHALLLESAQRLAATAP